LEYDGPIHFAAKKELINEKKILSAAIYMNAKEDTKIYKEVIKDILCVAPEYGKKIARMIFNKDLKCGNIFMKLEDEPNENNKIALGEEKDEFGIPIVKLFYKKSRYVLKTAKLFLEEFGNLCRNSGLGRIAIADNIYNLEGFKNLGVHHHMGGTRMGINKFDSVVNKDLKIHGINNLYISGSSSFVTTGYANPTFTIVQLAIRIAEKINERLHV
jgi:choline dehydrogenase-like flavoprotein